MKHDPSPGAAVIETLPPIGEPKLEWGVRMHLLLYNALTLTGLYNVERMSKKPLAQRQAPPAWLMQPPIEGAAITEREIPSRGGGLKLRIYKPSASDPNQPVLLFLHGGGFFLGSPPVCDYLCSRIAVGARMAVASLQYRLAPQFPFPAAIEDACDAVDWLSANPSAIASSNGVAMMGESAGASIIAGAAIEMKRLRRACVTHQTLLYPLLDCTLQSDSMRYRKGGIRQDHLDEMLKIYMPGADRLDPRASPLLASDLSGLPPALIVTADADPLRDDGHRYAKRLAGAGVPVRYVNVPDAIHGFFATPRWSRSGRIAIDQLVEAMRGLGARR